MNVVSLHDICIDCDGTRIYPSGATCKSCAGTGRVRRGDGIPVDANEKTANPTHSVAPQERAVDR